MLDEVEQERRVSGDHIPTLRADEIQRREDLLGIGTRRLQQAVVGKRGAHVGPGRPSTHREPVDGDQVVAEQELCQPAEADLDFAQLGAAAHPAVRTTARPRALVDLDVVIRDASTTAAILGGEGIDVVALRGLREQCDPSGG